MTKMERAQALRDCPDRHYNCCQSVFLPFAEALGLDFETAFKLSDHFGAGMRRGAACGAVTGGLMALGLMGVTGEEQAKAFQTAFENRAGAMDCRDLKDPALAKEVAKPKCDGYVRLAVELVEEMAP